MIKINVKGVKVAFCFSFFAVLAILFSIEGTSYIVLGLIACMLHELGHIAFMCIFGVPPKEMYFYGAGIKIIPNYTRTLSVRRELVILLAGSFSNLLIFAVIYFFSRGSFQAQLFSAINLIIGIFNLIPFRHFDGGRILELLLNDSSINNPYIIRRFVSAVMIILLGGLAGYMTLKGSVNPSFYISIGYIIFSEIML